jgi:hypothetical protein
MLNDTLPLVHGGTTATPDAVTPWHRRERWLVVCLASFLPVVIAIFAPQAWKVPLAVVTGVMVGAGLLMLMRKLRDIRIREDAERVLYDEARSSAQ